MPKIKLSRAMRQKLANSSNRLKKFVRNLTDPDCNDYLAGCCNCCGENCCGINCEEYPASITLTMNVLSGNIFCDNLFETSTLSFSTGGCTEFGLLVWTGTIADGVSGTLECNEDGWRFQSECDPLNWHPLTLISCCDPFELSATVNFTNFFGTCCEGEVELHFEGSYPCDSCCALTPVLDDAISVTLDDTSYTAGPCECLGGRTWELYFHPDYESDFTEFDGSSWVFSIGAADDCPPFGEVSMKIEVGCLNGSLYFATRCEDGEGDPTVPDFVVELVAESCDPLVFNGTGITVTAGGI